MGVAAVKSRPTLAAAAPVVLLLAAGASVAFGTRVVGFSDVLDGVRAALVGDPATSVAAAAVQQRIPRTLLAMLVGAALGLAGAVMQGVTRNPLADPAMLGITHGASLAVVVGVAVFGMASPVLFVWVAIAGAGAAAAFVYAVGSLGRGGATPLKLALAGAASSAAFSSLVSVVLLPRLDIIEQFRFWQIGGVGGATYPRMLLVAPFLAVGAVLCLAGARGLNSLALGDDVAAGLGEHTARTRVLAFTGAVTLCGAATAVAGPIAFVGLLVPHACRVLVGIDHRRLLPTSMVVGAALLTASDVIGRVVARPQEIDVGIVTALIGAPIFVVLVRRKRLTSR